MGKQNVQAKEVQFRRWHISFSFVPSHCQLLASKLFETVRNAAFSVKALVSRYLPFNECRTVAISAIGGRPLALLMLDWCYQLSSWETRRGGDTSRWDLYSIIRLHSLTYQLGWWPSVLPIGIIVTLVLSDTLAAFTCSLSRKKAWLLAKTLSHCTRVAWISL